MAGAEGILPQGDLRGEIGMIFVTVGTTYSFEALAEEVDKMAPGLNEKVIVQNGRNKYLPKNCIYFDFKDSLKEFISAADLVIAHGGAGTCFEALSMQKKMIAVANPDVHDNHQEDLLRKLSQEGYLVWCKDISELPVLIRDRKVMRPYLAPECRIHERIMGFLK
jgi:UDP-N-acetylglucosamine transferase subunit ALG13